jgi:hypothetical protein
MTILEDAPKTTLADVVENYDIVGVNKELGNEYVVVSPKQLSTIATGQVDMREIGTSAPSPFTSWVRQEYNFDLLGLDGLRIYDKMRRNDGTVKGTLRLVKTPILAANFFMQPASDSAKDKNIANFVWKNLTEWMTTSWTQFLVESMLCLDFGHYFFEKVYDFGENLTEDPLAKGKVIWRKFAPRHPMDVKEWMFDENGGPLAVELWPQNEFASGIVGGTIPGLGRQSDDVIIPIDKLLVFTNDKEAGNIEGISVLRAAYKHWYYKDNLYKIDAIQKERHGIGIPVIKLPPNFTVDDRNLADELGRNLRTNERAHVVLPPNWELEFAQIAGQPVNCIESIEHHDKQIRQNILAEFIGTGGTTKEEDQALFLKGTRFIASQFLDTMNMHAIPQLVRYNYANVGSGFPKLKARRIGEQADWRTLSFAVRNYIGANVIRPDDELEKSIRDEMGLPPIDEKTTRLPPTPQAGTPSGNEQPLPKGPKPPGNDPNKPDTPAPPKVGPPRQAPPSARPPKGNAGRDGGK